MEKSETKIVACCCDDEQVVELQDPPKSPTQLAQYVRKGIFGIIVWYLIYGQLPAFSKWITYTLIGLNPDSHLGASVEFFFYDVPKIFMLLSLIVFGVGIIRSFFTPERTRAMLVGKSEFVGNILAALLGIVTPFCTCSAVPLFIGFVTAGVPLGVTFSFLISSPMVNEIALALLFGLFGWKIAALYMGTGLLIAIASGWIIGKMNLEKHVEDWVYKVRMGEGGQSELVQTWEGRITFAKDAVKDILGKVWLYIFLGIAVGAGIHGYAPAEALAGVMGKSWWCVPLAVLLGVPMYSNAAGVIPIVQALLGKGAALGTTLAFMMAVIGLSLPETIILRKVLKPRLIAIFVGVVASGIVLVGYLFNAIL
ncbi:MAG: permease [Candidatus Ozemobacteraceae bacterium]